MEGRQRRRGRERGREREGEGERGKEREREIGEERERENQRERERDREIREVNKQQMTRFLNSSCSFFILGVLTPNTQEDAFCGKCSAGSNYFTAQDK